jgi:hypothetical protein
MGASQERADFFNATLLVVTGHPGGPTSRPKIRLVLPRFALFFICTVVGTVSGRDRPNFVGFAPCSAIDFRRAIDFFTLASVIC